MFGLFNKKHLRIALLLMLLVCCNNAFAKTLTCTFSFGKEEYVVGQTVTTYYNISFEDKYTEISCSWGIIPDWADGGSQWNSDDKQILSALEGEVCFVPPYGEGVLCEITLREPTGEWHTFTSEPVRIVGDTSSTPEISIVFEESSYYLGEPVIAHYDIVFEDEYTEISCSWGIIPDWADGGSQWSSDDEQILSALEGEVCFVPPYGEGVLCEITLREPTGEWHTFTSDPLPICTEVLILPSALTTIEEKAFMNTGVVCVVGSDKLCSIENLAFAGCTDLKTVVIPTSDTNVAENAFDGCISLKMQE